jgi:hypothetical protein
LAFRSRRYFVRAYLREAQQQVFDAHIRAFAFFGGVTVIDWQLSAATNSRYGSIVLKNSACTRGWARSDRSDVEHQQPFRLTAAANTP